MRYRWWKARRASLCALLLSVLCACAQVPEKVAVGIGTAAYMPEDAAPYAKLYLPYARMASLAYVNPPRPGAAGPGYCFDEAWLKKPESWDPRHTLPKGVTPDQWLRPLKAEWKCLFGGGPIACPVGLHCAQGLQYQVWRRRDCKEAVVAFRGTDPGDPGDVLSNLHWLAGAWEVDEYAQVHLIISQVLDKIDCRPRRIIATGHSLGGGLAQHAAYSDKRIGYVYAFDPSPVTGFFAVSDADRVAATSTLGIDRIYEAGEILSFARYIASGVFPSPRCHPRVRIVRFQVGPFADPVALHNMPALTSAIEKHAAKAKPGTVLPDGHAKAANCTFADAEQI